MPEFEKKERFLLTQFHLFYVRLIELKTAANAGTWVFKSNEEGAKPNQVESETKVTSGLLFQELVSLLEKQQLSVGQSGGEMGVKLYSDALFVMAAMADEVFLTMTWAGQEAWSKFLLENKFFGSNAGGDIFFLKLDTLLKNRDQVYAELATLFLLALSLGFRGKFHGINDAGAIDNYKDQLYTFIFQKPTELNSIEKKLFADAYLHTLEQKAKMVIPGLKKWYGLLALLAITLLGISHIIWLQMTGEIGKIVSQIVVN
jgi:type VI secretion system protein ImpK